MKSNGSYFAIVKIIVEVYKESSGECDGSTIHRECATSTARGENIDSCIGAAYQEMDKLYAEFKEAKEYKSMGK